MYPFHALTVHLPIGLLLGNAALTALYLRRGDPALETSAYHCLLLGWLGAALAVTTGIVDAARQLFDPLNPRDDALGWINAHGAIGLANSPAAPKRPSRPIRPTRLPGAFGDRPDAVGGRWLAGWASGLCVAARCQFIVRSSCSA